MKTEYAKVRRVRKRHAGLADQMVLLFESELHCQWRGRVNIIEKVTVGCASHAVVELLLAANVTTTYATTSLNGLRACYVDFAPERCRTQKMAHAFVAKTSRGVGRDFGREVRDAEIE